MEILQDWADYLVCPIDHTPLTQTRNGIWCCPTCSFSTPLVNVKDRLVPDFRAEDRPQTVSIDVQIPVTPLDRDEIVRTRFVAPRKAKVAAATLPNVHLKTKLDRGCQYYLQELYKQYGAELRILDLGCGNGDNRRFLNALGFQHVLAVDWIAPGADILVDAHRLPFAQGTFDVVVTTAVFEHLYNPFLAMSSLAHVLTDRAWFIGGASFWEAWHGSSYFHMTPDGWNTLLNQNGFQLDDLWVGWGIIPAALAHVITPGHFRRLGYWLQRCLEGGYRVWAGEQGVRKFQLRASGSYMVYASRAQRNLIAR